MKLIKPAFFQGRFIFFVSFVCFILCETMLYAGEWYVPIQIDDRTNIEAIQLTKIGAFGEPRKARPGIPCHLHTGADIKRPGMNFDNEPVYPASKGIVISLRDDGPFSQIIVEHNRGGVVCWTVYEHTSGITCKLGDNVEPFKPIARFMNKKELNKYGWQFDHFHFEIMKIRPAKVEYQQKHPERYFNTYALTCYSDELLNKRYYSPIEFLKSHVEK